MENSIEHVSEIDEELYGALLSANQAIDDTGGGLVIFSIISGVLISLGLHLTWFDRLFKVDLADLRHWYVYVIIVVVAFLVGAMLCSIPEKNAYHKYRRDITGFAHRAGLSKYQLVAGIEADEGLKKVAEWIKKDNSLEL